MEKQKISISALIYWTFLLLITFIVFVEMNRMGGVNEGVIALTFVVIVVQIIYIFKKKQTLLMKVVSWFFLLFFIFNILVSISASGAQVERERYLMEKRGK